MASKDIHNSVKTDVAFNLQNISSDTTTVGEIIDTTAFEGLEFFIQSGTIDGILTPKMEHGNDPALSDAADVPTDFLKGTIAEATFAATDDDKAKRIGYVGKKQYVRISLISSGGTSSSDASAIAVKGFPVNMPTDVDV